MTTTEKLGYALQQINKVHGTAKHIKKAKLNRVDFYTANFSQLESISEEQLKKHDFTGETLNLSHKFLKSSLLPKLLKNVVKLENHNFAPELNLLHFKGSVIVRTPNKRTITDALHYCIETMNFDQIKELC